MFIRVINIYEKYEIHVFRNNRMEKKMEIRERERERN